MKNAQTLIIIIVFILPLLPLYAKDFNKTEDVINNILSESRSENSLKDNKQQKTPKKDPDTIKKPSAKDNKDKGNSEMESPAMSSPDEVLLKTGIQLFNSGLNSHALKKFSELTSKFPQSAYLDSARIWIGKINIKQYKYNEAINQFSSIAEDSGEYPSAIFNIGECHMLKGDSIVSIEYYQKVSSRFPEHELADNALLKTGKLYLNNRKGNQALDATIKLIKWYRTRETIDDAFYLLGKIYEKDPVLKDLEIARKVYKLFLKKARKGNTHFQDSPLRNMVGRDLKHIEKNHFRLEN